MAPLVNTFLMESRQIIFSRCYYIPKLPKSEKGKRKRYPRTQFICVLSTLKRRKKSLRDPPPLHLTMKEVKK